MKGINADKNILEDVLLEYIYGSPARLKPPGLNIMASNVARLSGLFTKGRESLPKSYLKDKNLRSAYILYFLPSNLYKIHLPLKELSLHPEKPLLKERLKILDIGSGPGTVVLGVMDFFTRQASPPFLEFTAVDAVEGNLRDAGELFKLYKDKSLASASLKTGRLNIENPETIPEGHFDIIIVSNLLNELFYDDAIAKRVDILIKLMSQTMSEDGSCIIIEPALWETSREMLEVRDGLLKQGLNIYPHTQKAPNHYKNPSPSRVGVGVYSPCLICEPCPALINPNDWCHEDMPWTPPPLIKEIDKLTGLRKDSLKFSYLVLRKDNLSLSDIYGKESFRVVSEPLISKGKIEFYICGKGERKLITRLDKDKTTLNKAFNELNRGNVVCFEHLSDEGKRFRLGKDTGVFLKKPDS
ncbi:MAG: hypothetical protein HY097_09900 [Nitrospinae bacterium]|nr:hypothetical protein [Nitrospinota bacterium]